MITPGFLQNGKKVIGLLNILYLIYLIYHIIGGIIIFNLKAERRNQSVKVKRLRRENMVPASIYGKGLKESILIQIPLADVNRFLREASKGNTLTLEVENEKYHVLFKNISREPISQQAEHMEFQHLVMDEAVNNVAKVILINRDKNQNLIQQHVEEIPYNALPRHFVQDVVIDLDGMGVGSAVYVKDLDIAKDENIKLTIAEDIAVLNVASLKRAVVEEKAADEEQDA